MFSVTNLARKNCWENLILIWSKLSDHRCFLLVQTDWFNTTEQPGSMQLSTPKLTIVTSNTWHAQNVWQLTEDMKMLASWCANLWFLTMCFQHCVEHWHELLVWEQLLLARTQDNVSIKMQCTVRWRCGRKNPHHLLNLCLVNPSNAASDDVLKPPQQTQLRSAFPNCFMTMT